MSADNTSLHHSRAAAPTQVTFNQNIGLRPGVHTAHEQGVAHNSFPNLHAAAPSAGPWTSNDNFDILSNDPFRYFQTNSQVAGAYYDFNTFVDDPFPHFAPSEIVFTLEAPSLRNPNVTSGMLADDLIPNLTTASTLSSGPWNTAGPVYGPSALFNNAFRRSQAVVHHDFNAFVNESFPHHQAATSSVVPLAPDASFCHDLNTTYDSNTPDNVPISNVQAVASNPEYTPSPKPSHHDDADTSRLKLTLRDDESKVIVSNVKLGDCSEMFQHSLINKQEEKQLILTPRPQTVSSNWPTIIATSAGSWNAVDAAPVESTLVDGIFKITITDAKIRKCSKTFQYLVIGEHEEEPGKLFDGMLVPSSSDKTKLKCIGPGCNTQSNGIIPLSRNRHFYQTLSHWRAVTQTLRPVEWQRVFDDDRGRIQCPIRGCEHKLFVGSQVASINRHAQSHNRNDLLATLGKRFLWYGEPYTIVFHRK